MTADPLRFNPTRLSAGNEICQTHRSGRPCPAPRFNPTRLSAGNEMPPHPGAQQPAHVSIQPGYPPGMRWLEKPLSAPRCRRRFNPTRLSAGNEMTRCSACGAPTGRFNPTRLSAGNEMRPDRAADRQHLVSIQPGYPPGMRSSRSTSISLATVFQSNPAIRRE